MKNFIIEINSCFICLLCIFVTSCGKRISPDELSNRNPITFTYFTSDATIDMKFNDPVAKKITDETGVTLLIDYPKAGDSQAINLMIASGNYDDLIYAKGDASKLIDAHAVIALDDWISPDGKHVNLIETYGKNLKALYGDQLVKLRHSNGHIYSFGTYAVQNTIFETSGTMQIQHAVLKELGYPKINTLDDYATALRAYKKRYPEIDGKKTIGLSLLIGTWQWMIDLSNPSNYVIGYPDDGQWIVDRKTHHAQYKFLNPNTIYYYKWLNDLNADGTLDPESFTQTEEVWKSKIASGCVLGLSYPNWGYNDARTTLIASGKPERTYAYLPIVVDSKKYKDPSLTDYGFSGGWGISISTSCKDVIRAFKFIDWMCSEKAQILTNWGIEGVNYDVVDGKRVVPKTEQLKMDNDPDYAIETGVGRWVYPFPEEGNGAVDKNGDWITRNTKQRIIDNYLPIEKETLSAYGATMWTDLFPQSSTLGRPAHGQLWQYQLPKEINDKVSEADDYVKVALTKCVLCKPSEFLHNWNTMVQHLKDMGMEEAGDGVSALIEEKLKLWGVE
jgi:putative aldouronate transport system substrate-binding protein